MKMLQKRIASLDRWAAPGSLMGLVFLTLLFGMGIIPWVGSLANPPLSQTGLLDLRFTYTPETAFASIQAYGEQGRRVYAALALTVDLVFPVIYSLLLVLATGSALRRVSPAGSHLRLLSLFPFSVVALDWLENFSIALLLLSYPSQWAGLARLAGLFTTAKWTLLALSAVLLVLLVLISGFAKGGRRPRPA